MYLVDTSTVSYHQRGHPRVSQRINATSSGLLYISIVTVEEQLRGRLAVIANTDLEQTLTYFQSWQVLPFTDRDYQTFLNLRQQGIRISTRDLRIAASALNHGFIAVTSNVSDFSQVPGLTVEDWTV